MFVQLNFHLLTKSTFENSVASNEAQSKLDTQMICNSWSGQMTRPIIIPSHLFDLHKNCFIIINVMNDNERNVHDG